MTDIEKVIKGLEWILNDDRFGFGKGLTKPETDEEQAGCYIHDALELLKKKKRKNPERLLPCKCGCKRREHWYSVGNPNPIVLKCCKCGFQARGKNEFEAHKEWNKAILT